MLSAGATEIAARADSMQNTQETILIGLRGTIRLIAPANKPYAD